MQDNPKFNALSKALNATIAYEGRDYLYFGGTAYLGIPQNEAFLGLYIEGLQRFGLNNGTSRNNNVQLGIYNEVENYAAELFGAEEALITSSGFLAAQMAVKYVSGLGEVRYAPTTHPALWLNEVPKTIGSFESWAKSIVDEINTSRQKTWVLISNSMNNLLPEIYDFSFVEKIDQHKEIVLLIDDSHGIGINHNASSALTLHQQKTNVSVILVASMAKALGVDAGMIMGSKSLIHQIKAGNEFIGASPPAAAGLYAFMHGEKIYSAAREQLKENMLVMAAALSGNPDWEFITDFPVYFSKNADISNRLLQHRILVSSFPYPDKDGAMINRIVLSSWHNITDINKLIKSLL